ncbi:MAG: radical SAM protein [Pseudomonadota bacterium]
MKIALAIAPWRHAETYPPSQGRSNRLSGRFGLLGGATPPLSLLGLSSWLEAHGHQTSFTDGFFLEEAAFMEHLLAGDPAWVGLWATQFSWERTAALAREVKARAPGVAVVVGGNHATALGARLLEEPGSEGVDFLVGRDGEDPSLELCEVLDGRRSAATVRGLVWRDGDRVVQNAQRPYREDLDALPFPNYDLIDLGVYAPAIGSYNCLPSVNMMTTRGCAGHCAFCHAANSLRARSVDNVMEEIRWLRGRFGVRHLLFFDETFTWERERVVEICRRMMEERIHISWTCNSRVDTMDPSLLALMRRAGCWRVQLGGESGVQKNLDAIGKGVSVAQNRRGVEMVRAADMEAFISFIFGIPGETWEEGLQTIRFAVSLPATYVNFLNCIPLAGSQLYAHAEQHGRWVGPAAFHLLSWVPHSMSYDQLADLLVRGPRAFYFRPRYLVSRALRMRSFEDLRRNARGLLAFAGLDPKRDFGAAPAGPLSRAG